MKLFKMFAASVIIFLTNWTTAGADPLGITGHVIITADGESHTYHTVQVKRETRAFRSSTYTDYRGEYVILVGAYEDPQPSEDLEVVIPVIAERRITAHAYINADGQETRSAQITWEADPEGRFYWGTDQMSDDVALELDSFSLDPEEGHFKGKFSGRVCHRSLPVIRVNRENCKDITVRVDSELTKLW